MSIVTQLSEKTGASRADAEMMGSDHAENISAIAKDLKDALETLLTRAEFELPSAPGERLGRCTPRPEAPHALSISRLQLCGNRRRIHRSELSSRPGFPDDVRLQAKHISRWSTRA